MAKTKPQLMIIHGGMTFKNNKDYLKYLKTRKVSLDERITWSRSYLDKQLGRYFKIIRPNMPLKDNAKYNDWKINFENYFPQLKNNIVLIGNSLGGIFLAKYLSENKFPRKILATYLVCAPFDDSLSGEDLAGGFKLKQNLSHIQKNSPHLNLLFAKKDDVVPVSHAEKYRKKLKNANIIIYKHIPGHFAIQKFPEIVKMIKQDLKRIKH